MSNDLMLKERKESTTEEVSFLKQLECPEAKTVISEETRYAYA